MLEPEHGSHPLRALKAADAKTLTDEIPAGLDNGSSNDIVHPAAVKRCHELQLDAADRRVERGGSPCVADLHLPGTQAGYQHRTTAYEDQLRIDAVLGKKAIIFSDPYERCPGHHRGVSEDKFRRSRGCRTFTSPTEENNEKKKESCDNFHEPLLVRAAVCCCRSRERFYGCRWRPDRTLSADTIYANAGIVVDDC